MKTKADRSLIEQHKTGRFLEIGPGFGYQTAEVAQKYSKIDIIEVEASIRSIFPHLSISITKQDDSLFPQTQDTIKPLCELKRGQTGLIFSIKSNTPEHLQELLTMGITPNAIVSLIYNYGRYVVFKVNSKEFAADKEITSGIAVQILR